MMSEGKGWYYLHTNGELIYKRDLDGTAADIRESPFATALWPIDLADRATAWRVLVEGLTAGAKPERVKELAEKWKCTDEDAQQYADYIGNVRLFKDGDQWCATLKDFQNLQESPAGFGEACLEALSELCRELGYKPTKIWGASFDSLCLKAAGEPR